MCGHDRVFINTHRMVLLAEEESSSRLTCLAFSGEHSAVARPLRSPCATSPAPHAFSSASHDDRCCSEPLGLGQPLGASLIACHGQTVTGSLSYTNCSCLSTQMESLVQPAELDFREDMTLAKQNRLPIGAFPASSALG